MNAGLHDLVISGGTCFDGLGSAGVQADVAISGGVVTEILLGVRRALRGQKRRCRVS